MADAGAYAVYADARTRIRDAAKWIVTVLASAIALIIGGGLIANIPTLDPLHIVGAAVCLFGLTFLCVIPLMAAIDILVSPFVTFETMTKDDRYKPFRPEAESYLGATSEFKSMEDLLRRRSEIVAGHADTPEKVDAKNKALSSVEEHIRPAVELISVRLLEKRFRDFVVRMQQCAGGIALLLFAFLLILHRDTTNDELLQQPTLISLPRTVELQSVLQRSGLSERCYANIPLTFVRLANMSGTRAIVIAVPLEVGGECQPTRLVLSANGRINAAP
jgi:hypothetical protein